MLAPFVAEPARTWAATGAAGDRHRRIDGSVVFVDVSGFTKMSERLARLGRVGAEHVTDVINQSFVRLLGEAAARGGMLLKFGGDALLLFFSGPGHELRATAAAWAMRRTLREHGTLTTAAGRVTLRMTAGVHSAPFDFFLVGGSHRELVLAGPAATAAAAVEEGATTGQILVGPRTAAALRPANVGAAVDDAYVLRGAVTAPAYDAAPVVPDTDLQQFVPVAMREVLTGGANRAEHRRVTIAFIHFDGVDDIVEREGPDAAASALDELVRAVQDAVDPRGVCFLGTDLAPGGGKIILTAGAPIAQGEDEEQMLLALRDIVEHELTLPLEIGVNAGPVFAGDIGTPERRTYTVMGDAVNLSARVMARAHHGEILATPAVLNSSRTLFETTALEPFFVKGKRRPVTAYTIGPARGARTEVAAADLPLVGRDDALARAAPMLAGVHEGAGGVIDIVGEAGSGKSRFLREIEQRAAPATIRRVQCRLYQAATAYFPIGQLLAAVVDLGDDDPAVALATIVRRHAPTLEPWLSLLGVPFGIELPDSEAAARLDDSFRKQRLEDSVIELLAALVDAPTVFVFEDAHWMDDASGDLVRALARASSRRPWIVCVTRRPLVRGLALDDLDGTVSMALEPLDVEATAQLVVAATAGAPLPQHVARELARRSSGNPLFLLELLSALREGGDLSSLPSTVEGLLAARVDRLPPDDRARLRRVAVLGAGFHLDHLGAVDADDIPVDLALNRLAEFLSADATGWTTFRHALVRDVAYSGLPYTTRRRLHAQVAESILRQSRDDGDSEAALLSLHFFQAQRYEESWSYARLAADAARDVYANVEAATLYTRALDAARAGVIVDDGARVAVLESLGDVQDRAGLFAEARAAYAAARRELASDTTAAAGMLLKEAFVAERRGRYTEAVRAIHRAERMLVDEHSDGADRLRAQLRVWLAAIRASQGSLTRAIVSAREGVELAVTARDELARARGLLVLDFAESACGVTHDWERTLTALDIYVAAGDLTGEAAAENNLGFGAYFAGRWKDALSWYESSRIATLRLGDPVNAALADANIAEILADQGRLAEADAVLTDAEATWSAAEDPWGVAFARRLRGVVASRAGRYEAADEFLRDAGAGFDEIGARFDVVATELAIADAQLRAGEVDAARGSVERLEATAGASEQLGARLAIVHGLVLAHAGAFDAARARLDEALIEARASKNDYDVVLALDALAAVDRALGRSADAAAVTEAAAIRDRLDIVALPGYPALLTRAGQPIVD